jgi:hypothetical protein
VPATAGLQAEAPLHQRDLAWQFGTARQEFMVDVIGIQRLDR